MHDIFQHQLSNAYNQYLGNYILGTPYNKVILRGGKQRPATTAALHEAVRYYQSFEKTADRKGWTIEWESWKSKKLGTQQWPASISIGSPVDLLYLTDKQLEFDEFTRTLSFILQQKPVLREWLAEKPERVLEFKEEWPGLFAVVDFLLANEVSDYYLRNIPVPVHTKFIETYKTIIWSILSFINPERFSIDGQSFEQAIGFIPKPYLFTLRWLDKSMAEAHTNGIAVMGLAVEDLRQLNWPPREIWVVENETALYMLPATAGGLAIWSRGKALTLLSDIPLFSSTALYYWGDLDEDGFAMLNDFRGLYPHVKSRFMDIACINVHLPYLDIQPRIYRTDKLDRLSREEHEAYDLLVQKNGRLEQEKLLQSYVNGYFPLSN